MARGSRPPTISRAAGEQSIAATSNPGLDVRVSSWANEDLHYHDFGPVVGKAERPRFVDGAREGLVYFLPKDWDREIVVVFVQGART